MFAAIHNGIGFHELGNCPGKHQICQFLFGWLALTDYFKVAVTDLVIVAVLNQQTTIDALVVPGVGRFLWPLTTGQDAHIGFCRQHFQRFVVYGRSNDHFAELLIDNGLGGSRIQRPVKRNDAAKR